MTTGIKNWSTTPGDNNSTAPNGFPEGMAPSQVNDSARQVMAEVRDWYEDADWIDFGHSGLTYVDTDTFRITGDVTDVYTVGRRVRAIGTTPFTIYGTISASTYDSTNTSVDVTWDSGSLDNTLSEVAVGAENTNKAIAGSGVSFAAGDVPASAIGVNASASKTADYTIASTDLGKTILVDATSGDVTVDADASTLGAGFEFTLVKTDSGSNSLIFDPTSSQTVNGTATKTKTNQYGRFTVVSDGSNWIVTQDDTAFSTDAELATGTETNKATTPANIKNQLGFSKRYASSEQTISDGGTITLPHSLSAIPILIQVSLVCKTAELGYAVGDEVEVVNSASSSVSLSSTGISIAKNATNVILQLGSLGQAIHRRDGITGNYAAITNGNWRVKVIAWA